MKNSKITNIAELQAELDRLTKLVYFDELTGVHNRRGFMEEAGRVFRSVVGSGAAPERRTEFKIPFSVIFIDLDNFKVLNDTKGHAAGDEALKTVADLVRHNLRTSDVLGRLGGEEFVIALVNVDTERAATTAEKLRAHIYDAGLSASFGVAEHRDDEDLEALIKRADEAMYKAKQAGKNRVAVV